MQIPWPAPLELKDRQPFGVVELQVFAALRQKWSAETCFQLVICRREWALAGRMRLPFVCLAIATTPADFESSYPNLKASVSRKGIFQPVEKIACILLDLPALETRKVNVVPARPHLVVVLLAFEMHQIQLVDEPEFLQ